jgi:hypothetical protein
VAFIVAAERLPRSAPKLAITSVAPKPNAIWTLHVAKEYNGMTHAAAVWVKGDDMTKIPPLTTTTSMDRAREAMTAMEAIIRELVADANAAGWGSKEVLNAIVETANKQRLAYEEDPDPSDGPAVDAVKDLQVGHGEVYD